VSASDDRINRRLLRKLLKGLHCPACSQPVDERAHMALWFDHQGRPRPHLVCHGCISTARTPADVDALASRCALSLCEPGGHA
jgi:hypothetical protein